MLSSLQIPTNSLDLFIRSVEISSYIPGRVRLYSKKLQGNTKLEQEIKVHLSGFQELNEIHTNTVSGSILLTYDTNVLRKNPQLKKVEDYIMTHVKKKA